MAWQDEVDGGGLGLYLHNGHLQANMVLRWLDDGARVESEATVELKPKILLLFVTPST